MALVSEGVGRARGSFDVSWEFALYSLAVEVSGFGVVGSPFVLRFERDAKELAAELQRAEEERRR